MKVKITKTKTFRCWYANDIGKEYEVQPVKFEWKPGIFLWNLKEQSVGDQKRIWEEDCVVVSEKPTQTKLFRMIRMD